MTKTLTQKLTALSVVVLLGSSLQLHAQVSAEGADYAPDGKNLVKMNVAALALKNFSFQYERAIGNKMSVAMGFRFMPKGDIPFKGGIKDLVDDEQTKTTIETFKTSNIAITPEVRFYMGKGVFQGFYVAPFLRYAKYNAEGPFDFSVTLTNGTNSQTFTQSVFFKGGVNTYTGGVLIGAQWKLSKLVYLDWWILGPSYGFSKGGIATQQSLNALEQQELRKQIGDFVDDLPIVKATYNVDGNGANIDFKGPWAGARAGLNLGFRF